MFDRPQIGNKAILVDVECQSVVSHDFTEFKNLALAADAEVVGELRVARKMPSAKYLIGQGKVNELADIVNQECADLVLFNHSLSPAQERNLEKAICCRVLDRTGLILDIFANRARTFEGKLQVELAQLDHLSTRLVRGWTHLERQKGGIGLRGPGETQLETDRRLLGNRIKTIKQRLEKIKKQRHQSRRHRVKQNIYTVALVGYTNAGKSTLFNWMSEDDSSMVADQLFATLDPTFRRCDIPELGGVVLIDTVGFVSDLPHELVVSFHATLEETRQADLLLHVIDETDETQQRKLEVEQVLEDIGADKIPRVLVHNKIDLIEISAPRLVPPKQDRSAEVFVSAHAQLGLDLLKSAIAQTLVGDIDDIEFDLQPEQGQLRAFFHQRGVVLSEASTETGGFRMTVRMSQSELEKVLNKR